MNNFPRRLSGILIIAATLVITAACLTGTIATESSQFEQPSNHANTQPKPTLTRTPPFTMPTRLPGAARLTPTPDTPRVLPTLRKDSVDYQVEANDTLARISTRYGISLNALISANEISNPDLISLGQVLVVPPVSPVGNAPVNKILPDSELVYGPASTLLDAESFIKSQGGYLASYSEEVSGEDLSGIEIVTRVSREYSVNPRVLLALLEFQSQWLTGKKPSEISLEYPLLYKVSYRKGLYPQLIWAANNLNRGYYLWKANAIGHYILADDSVIATSSGINPGTAAVQYLMSLFYGKAEWESAVSEQGFKRTFEKLFGDPFDFTLDPLVPETLTQPVLQLPFEEGAIWSFTGGPHAGWGDGSAWAAIDFAPPGDALGCVTNDAWVTAAAGGLVTRSENGVVVVDLDLDGYDQTGWTLLYLHIETRNRVAVGTLLTAGDRIGHPSCEGGVSTGTHVHFARRYNGEWIAADGNLPFILEGWTSQGSGVEYDGFLVRDEQKIEAWEGRLPENQIQR